MQLQLSLVSDPVGDRDVVTPELGPVEGADIPVGVGAPALGPLEGILVPGLVGGRDVAVLALGPVEGKDMTATLSKNVF